MPKITYTVADMSCGHRKTAVCPPLERVAGVLRVPDTKRVVVRGEDLDDAGLKAAIADAGYEAA